MLDIVCALEKSLLLQNKRFNHHDQRCSAKGVTFGFLLHFMKELVSKASLKHPHILQRVLLFHRHFSETSATQLLQTVAEVHAKQGFSVCQKVCQPRLSKTGKLSRYLQVNHPHCLDSLGQGRRKKKKRWGPAVCSSKNLSYSLIKKKGDKKQGKAFTKNEGKNENMVTKTLTQTLFSKRHAGLKQNQRLHGSRRIQTSYKT